MWASRSLLRRPIALVTSRLRPVRRHDATQTTVLGKNLISSRGYTVSDAAHEDSLESDHDRQLGRSAATKRHLYLVLDDHEYEYGIYKLDLDAAAETDSDSPRPLPQPAVIRLEVPKPQDHQAVQFAAVGSCIVTTGAGCGEHPGELTEGDALTFVYDTKTAALSTACDLPEGMSGGYDAAVAIGGALYVFESTYVARPAPHDHGPQRRRPVVTAVNFRRLDENECLYLGLGWRPFSGSSRCFWSYDKVMPPFNPGDIKALAVDGWGHGIFASIVGECGRYAITFDYDPESERWTRIGDWRLPFRGHAGYDGELDAWVGFHADDGEGGAGTDGHLCACRVPSPRHDWALEWKLVHMGERGEYCLVERLLRRREGANDKECIRDGDECLLRLATFRVQYDEDGELIVATAYRRARSYRVSRFREHFEAQAFWI
ncbi:unnamed protein product [Alopecurus aequalis]